MTCGALSVCSSLPSTARLLLPTRWRRQFQPRVKNRQGRGGGGGGEACLCVFRGMTEKDMKHFCTTEKKKRNGGKKKPRRLSVRVCFHLKSLNKSKKNHDGVHFFFQSWETSDAKCQRARWNTDKFLLFRFSPQFIFKQMLWIFLCYYTSSAERKKERKKLRFPPTELGNKESVCQPRNTRFCSTKKKKMGAGNKKNHIRATSEPQDGRQIAAGCVFFFFFLQKDSSAEWTSDLSLFFVIFFFLLFFYCQLVLANILFSNFTHSSVMPLQTRLYLKTTPLPKTLMGVRGGKKACEWGGIRKRKRKNIESRSSSHECVYYLYHITHTQTHYVPLPLPSPLISY